MAIKVKKEDKDKAIIYLKGRLDIHLSNEIENEINELIKKEGIKHLIVNLQDVEYMSSSGLRVLVATLRIMKESDGDLKLCCLTLAVRKIFEVVELIDMFDIYRSEDEAISSWE
jgi:anti-anti-sigma factor